MKEFLEKHELAVTIGLIIIYVVSNSICAQNFKLTDYRTAICNMALSLAILVFIIKNNLREYYGLIKLTNSKRFLYFLPLYLIVSVNFWNGINMNHTIPEIIFFIISMIGVGFLEEIIYRGFLFKMMEKDNVKLAVIVSSITFGIGHIVNLLNGEAFIPTLLQICYSTSIGFLFVTIFQKSKSLLPCIIAHSALNALYIFYKENDVLLYTIPILFTIISIWYTLYIKKHVK